MWFRNILSAKSRRTGLLQGIWPRDRQAQGQALAGSQQPPGSQPAQNGQAGAGLSPRALRQLKGLRLNTGPLLLAQPVGARSSRMRRAAADFREHRQYVPGDDVRYVDWTASARQEHIFIKQGEYQKAATVYLLLDCSASMEWGSPPKSAAALQLAYALGYLALANNDRLIVLPVGGMPDGGAAGEAVNPGPENGANRYPLGPLWGKGQLAMLGRFLRTVRFGGQADITAAMAGLPGRRLSRGGLVLVISDLLAAQDLAGALERLPAPGWNTAVCHLLHPAELNPGIAGHLEMEDIETGGRKQYTVTEDDLKEYTRRLNAWKDQTRRECTERKAVYTSLSTGMALETEILPQLVRARVVEQL